LTDEDTAGDPVVATTLTAPTTGTGDTLIITPNGELKDDHIYKYICIVYANGAVDTDGDGNCDSGDACVAVSARSFGTKRSYTTVPAAVTTFVKNAAITTFADNLTSYSFEWTGVANASGGYYIYAKGVYTEDYDGYINSDYVRVAGPLTTTNDLDMFAATINLASFSQFDRYAEASPDQTPLAGITMSFMITASNYYGESIPSSVSPNTAVTFTDNVTPIAGVPAQPAPADNSSGTTAKTITVTVGFDEIMNATTAIAVTIAETGGDGSYVLPSTAITAAWDDGGRGLTVTLVVPAGKNGAGDTISLIHSQFKDLTGNVMLVTESTAITKTL